MKRTQRTSTGEIRLRARELRQRITRAEDILWHELRDRRLGGYKFRRQHPIGQYIADFFCSEASLVLELDGEIHEQVASMERDSRRDLAMLDHGLQVLRIRNQEVIQDPPKVLAKIRRLLPSPHGRGAGVRGM